MDGLIQPLAGLSAHSGQGLQYMFSWLPDQVSYVSQNETFILHMCAGLSGHVLSTVSSQHTSTDTFANSAHRDETAHNEPSHQDLHCLPCSYYFLTKTPVCNNDVSKFRDGKVYFRRSGVKGYPKRTGSFTQIDLNGSVGCLSDW